MHRRTQFGCGRVHRFIRTSGSLVLVSLACGLPGCRAEAPASLEPMAGSADPATVVAAAGPNPSPGQGQGAADEAALDIPAPPSIDDLAAHEIDPASIARIEAALAAVEAAPTSAAAWRQLGMEYQANEMNAQAAPCYAQAIVLDPEEPKARFHLARIEAAAGRLDQAAEAMRAAIDLEPDYPASHWRLGLIQLDRGELDDAERRFEAALALDPGSEAARIGLARVALGRSSLEEAVERLEAVIAMEGRNAAYARRLLGQALQRLGRSDEAEAALAGSGVVSAVFSDLWSEDVELLRVSYGNRSRIGERLLRSGETQEGVAVLEALRAEHPDEPGVLVNLGVGYAMLGRMDEAIETFQAYLLHDPDHAITRENLARALLRRGLQAPEGEREAVLGEALSHAERAAAIASGSAAAQALRGDILRALQRLEPAADAYATAAALAPGDERVRDALADLERALNRSVGPPD